MEKAWEVFVPIWKEALGSKENAEKKEFRAFAHTEEDAKLRGLVEAAKAFPIEDGWAYDVEAITLREITHEEMGERLEQKRQEIAEESKPKLDAVAEEIERLTGRKLNRPE